MNNSIIELLNLAGDDIEIIGQSTTGETLEITISKKDRVTVCP